MVEPGLRRKSRRPEFCGLGEIASRTDGSPHVVISEPRVHSLFGAAFPPYPLILVPEGEAAKSCDTLLAVFGKFAEMRVDRSWTVLAIGGGSVSDTAGFAAHLWMRGIGFSCAPTTLLAMADAALGGKNAVDFGGCKNVLGSFHMPKRVYCDLSTLRSLEPDQFSSGMAEIIKHALIQGEDLFARLELLLASGRPVFDHRMADADLLRAVIAESQEVKMGIVDEDFRENDRRRLLNLGHSFGHAIESLSGLPHGSCVSLGIMISCRAAVKRGKMDAATAARIRNLFLGFGLPVECGGVLPSLGPREVAALVVMDKKRKGGVLHFVMPHGIGDVRIEGLAMAGVPALLEDGWL